MESHKIHVPNHQPGIYIYIIIHMGSHIINNIQHNLIQDSWSCLWKMSGSQGSTAWGGWYCQKAVAACLKSGKIYSMHCGPRIKIITSSYEYKTNDDHPNGINFTGWKLAFQHKTSQPNFFCRSFGLSMTHLQVIWYTDWSQRTAHAALNLAAQPSCPCRPGRRWGLKPWKNNLQTSHEMVDWLNRQETVWIVNFQKILMSQSLNPIMPSISFYDSMIRRIKGAMTQRSFENISAVWMLCLWALVVIQPPVYTWIIYIRCM